MLGSGKSMVIVFQVQRTDLNPGIPHQKVANLNDVTLACPKVDLKVRSKDKAHKQEKEWLKEAKKGVSRVLVGRTDESWGIGSTLKSAAQLLTGSEAAQRLLGTAKSEAVSRQSIRLAEASYRQTEETATSSGSASSDESAYEDASEEATVSVLAKGPSKQLRGEYIIDLKKIRVEGQGLMSQAAFCKEAGCRNGKAWESHIFVHGDSLGRSLADWLKESCETCKSPNDEANLLICSLDTCQRLYHIYCLSPPLKSLPPDDEDWFCPRCQANGSKNQ